MEGKVNQYYFDKMKNSRIIITEEIYTRLIELTQLTRIKKEEQMCMLYGGDLNNNQLLFYRINQNTDYLSSGGGSDNPYKHGVQIGKR